MQAVQRVTCHFDIAVPAGGDPSKFEKEMNEGLSLLQEAFPPEWGKIVGATADSSRPLSTDEIQKADYAKELTS